MDKLEEKNLDKLVSERGNDVMKAIDKWFEQIPKEKQDKPFMANLCMDSKILTPRDLHKELTEQISRKSVSKETKGFLSEIIKRYGGENK
jgi:hypothetical protein